MIIADGPLNLSLEDWVASSVSGIACIFNNQIWWHVPVAVKAWDEQFGQHAHGNLISNLCCYLQKSCCHAAKFFFTIWKATFY
jgi:hypothetical protein